MGEDTSSVRKKRKWAGGCKYLKFLNSSVNPINNYIFGILTSRAIDWYIDETILRGLGGEVGGESGNSCEGLQDFTGPRSSKYKYIFGILSSSSVDVHHCWVI